MCVVVGTSRSNVVNDYLERMGRAAQKLQLMMANMLQHIITRHEHRTPLLTHSLFTIDLADPQQSEQSDAKQSLYAPVVLFNPLAWHRQQLVSVKVSTRHVRVEDHTGKEVKAQVSRCTAQHSTAQAAYTRVETVQRSRWCSPVLPLCVCAPQVDVEWDSLTASTPQQGVFAVHFVASLPPLATRTYFLHLSPTPHASAPLTEHSVTTVYSQRNAAGTQRHSQHAITRAAHQQHRTDERWPVDTCSTCSGTSCLR